MAPGPRRRRHPGHARTAPSQASLLWVTWNMLRPYAEKVGIRTEGFCLHSLRAMAITQALEGGSKLNRVQAWAGHASPVTTKIYDKRDLKPERSPTFNTNY